jgi:hypothetical protein
MTISPSQTRRAKTRRAAQPAASLQMDMAFVVTAGCRLIVVTMHITV